VLRAEKKGDQQIEALIEALIRDAAGAPVGERDRALLEYAVKLTREPWAMSEDDIAKLRRAGWSDGAVLDLNLVASYYNYVNRLADGLGVPLEARWQQD